MTYRSKILLLLLSALLLVACSKKAVYVDESFSNDSPFKLRVTEDVTLSCESARRSLLGQGYLIELANSDEVKARKATRGENTFIEMNVVCVPESNGSTVFATGVLSSYDMKKNTSSASVGLSALGSISLPIGQSIDSLVKVSEETIDDKGFYKRFFTAVETQLSEMSLGPESGTLVEPDTEQLTETPPASASTAPPIAEEPMGIDPPAAVDAAPPEPELNPDEEPLGINPEWSLTPQENDAGQAAPQQDSQSTDTELINDLF